MATCGCSKEIFRNSYDLLYREVSSQYKDQGWTESDMRRETARIFRPRYKEDVASYKRENSGLSEYVVAEFVILDGHIFFPSYGTSLERLHENQMRQTPDQYSLSDHQTSRMIEEALRNGATQVVTSYAREGSDNRDVVWMKYDPVAKRGEQIIINTATDGNYHTFKEIQGIANSRFSDLYSHIASDRVFILSDVRIPPERAQQVIQSVVVESQRFFGEHNEITQVSQFTSDATISGREGDDRHKKRMGEDIEFSNKIKAQTTLDRNSSTASFEEFGIQYQTPIPTATKHDSFFEESIEGLSLEHRQQVGRTTDVAADEFLIQESEHIEGSKEGTTQNLKEVSGGRVMFLPIQNITNPMINGFVNKRVAEEYGAISDNLDRSQDKKSNFEYKFVAQGGEQQTVDQVDAIRLEDRLSELSIMDFSIGGYTEIQSWISNAMFHLRLDTQEGERPVAEIVRFMEFTMGMIPLFREDEDVQDASIVVLFFGGLNNISAVEDTEIQKNDDSSIILQAISRQPEFAGIFIKALEKARDEGNDMDHILDAFVWFILSSMDDRLSEEDDQNSYFPPSSEKLLEIPILKSPMIMIQDGLKTREIFRQDILDYHDRMIIDQLIILFRIVHVFSFAMQIFKKFNDANMLMDLKDEKNGMKVLHKYNETIHILLGIIWYMTKIREQAILIQGITKKKIKRNSTFPKSGIIFMVSLHYERPASTTIARH
ncbi:MAG: hypothetical protein N3A54_02285 [Patescibacteria group bacterium]|nr:hypothetical protein [Patescibacteria group bacterium]